MSNVSPLLDPFEKGLCKLLESSLSVYGFISESNNIRDSVEEDYIKNKSTELSNRSNESKAKSVLYILYQRTSPIQLSQDHKNTKLGANTILADFDDNNIVEKAMINSYLTYDINILCAGAANQQLLEFLYYITIYTESDLNLVMKLGQENVPLKYKVKFSQLNSNDKLNKDMVTNIYNIAFSVEITGPIFSAFSSKLSKDAEWGLELWMVGKDMVLDEETCYLVKKYGKVD